MTPKKKHTRPEEHLQRAAANYLSRIEAYVKTLTFYHPPNELMRTSKLKLLYTAFGSKAGVPDLIIFIKGGKTVFVELKAGKNDTTEKQDIFEAKVQALGFSSYLINAMNPVDCVRRLEEILRKEGAL